MKCEIADCFESGKLFTLSDTGIFSESDWTLHKTFKGVYLKTLVSGLKTDGEISCYLVKIEPDCEIGFHIHENSMEIHEVISGSGSIFLDESVYEYVPGNMSIIPKKIAHKVKAEKEGLILMAKFIPAL